MIDVVIPLKRAMLNDELKYTLRSICQNVPHNQVWLAGYRPDWSTAGWIMSPREALGVSKYIKATNNLLAACKDPRVTEDFYLFNDDFFVMKPVDNIEIMHRGTLLDHLEKYKRSGVTSIYSRGLQHTHDVLKEMGIENPLSYELHIPLLTNKTKWLEAYRERAKFGFSRYPVYMRSFYGNMFNIGGKRVGDVKIENPNLEPTGQEAFLSSNDGSFMIGKLGAYIRSSFKDRCKYEA